MDYEDVIERIYDHVESDRLESAVMACVRLARRAKDHVNAAVFLRELYGDKSQVERALAEDIRDLKEDVVRFVYERSFGIWLDGRTLPPGLDAKQEKTVQVLGVADVEASISNCERRIEDLTVPPGMSEFDTAAFTDAYVERKGSFRRRITADRIIRNRIKARCYNYAVSMEKQFVAQKKPELFLQAIQVEVNNFFGARSEDVYTKLQKAAQLVVLNDTEDNSLLLTEVRRAIKSVADYFYPAEPEAAICSDGKARKLTDSHYLNRLHEYTLRNFLSGSTTDELFRAELQLLMAFAGKLNDISAKGVHASVTAEEARLGFVGLYMFLYTLVVRLQAKPPAA